MISDSRATRSFELAIDVPGRPSEAAAWRTRNLCELLLFFHAFGGPVTLIDEGVKTLRLSATQRLSHRLFALRTLVGPCPKYYSIPEAEPAQVEIDERLNKCADALLRYSSALRTKQPPDEEEISPKDGVGASGIAKVASWRTIGSKTRFSAIDTDVSAELMWRSWTGINANTATVLVPDEFLTPTRIDIWWGIHNGAHLDHLSSLIRAGEDPLTIEFGSGLLVAESVAMVHEMIAGAECVLRGLEGHAYVVADGIDERVGRDPTLSSGHTGLSLPMSGVGSSALKEFAPLPTLSRAYIEGPLKLLATGFEGPLIPEDLSRSLSQKCEYLATSLRPFEVLMNESKDIFNAR